MVDVTGEAGAKQIILDSAAGAFSSEEVLKAVRFVVFDWFENKEGGSIYCDEITAETVASDVLSQLSKQSG